MEFDCKNSVNLSSKNEDNKTTELKEPIVMVSNDIRTY